MEYKYKSDEEFFFSLWLDELKAEGYITDYTYEPEPIILSDKIQRSINVRGKLATQFVMHPHEYTYDFLIEWDKKALGVFVTQFESAVKSTTPLYCDKELFSHIEIKPEFDFKNMTREVTLNIKWVYETKKIFVNLVKVPSFFKKSFTPYKYISTKNGKLRKIKYSPVLKLSEYIDKIDN